MGPAGWLGWPWAYGQIFSGGLWSSILPAGTHPASRRMDGGPTAAGRIATIFRPNSLCFGRWSGAGNTVGFGLETAFFFFFFFLTAADTPNSPKRRSRARRSNTNHLCTVVWRSGSGTSWNKEWAYGKPSGCSVPQTAHDRRASSHSTHPPLCQRGLGGPRIAIGSFVARHSSHGLAIEQKLQKKD